MSKIYTKTGDKGKTGLIGGSRVSKSDLRLDAYGEVDELNSVVGLLLANGHNKISGDDQRILTAIQNALFIIGSHLACEADKAEQFKLPSLPVNIISEIEARIDTIQSSLPKLTNFILPAGSTSACFAHLCRTVSRRVERRVVAVGSNDEVKEEFYIFLNRISDYFFVLARQLNLTDGLKEIIWKG